MDHRTFQVKSIVWLYQRSPLMISGQVGAWHFVTIDKDTSAEIKRFDTFPRRGFGAIRVKVKIGETSWETSVFWEKKGTYILPIKKEIRKKESIKEGDEIDVVLKVVSK